MGELVAIGTRRGREVKPKLKVGVCGEHGGDPRSIEFFNHVGLDYVSCSPFRVPIARLAAARASLAEKNVGVLVDGMSTLLAAASVVMASRRGRRSRRPT